MKGFDRNFSSSPCKLASYVLDLKFQIQNIEFLDELRCIKLVGNSPVGKSAVGKSPFFKNGSELSGGEISGGEVS